MQSAPFSILIPTRQRHDTLKHAIESVLDQTFGEFELVVSDNCSSPETQEVVEEFSDARIRYFRTPSRLAMADNWEFGLARCTGANILVIGDDDGLLPDSLAIAWELLSKTGTAIVSWRRIAYGWPTCAADWLKNRLSLPFDEGFERVDSRIALKKFYAGGSIDDIPMIYNSVVDRKLVERIRAINGQYFPTSIPDVHSGIVNAYFSQSFVRSYRSLSISGVSGHSTGMSQTLPGVNQAAANTFLSEMGRNSWEDLHPDLRVSFSGHPPSDIIISDARFRSKERYFPGDRGLKVNILATLQACARKINEDPAHYETTLSYIREIAGRHRIPLSFLGIPPKGSPRRYSCGIQRDVLGRVSSLIVDCEALGIVDVAQAARLCAALRPAWQPSAERPIQVGRIARYGPRLRAEALRILFGRLVAR